MDIDVLIDLLYDMQSKEENFFIEAEAKRSRMKNFINDYNIKYLPEINMNSDGIIEMNEDKNKWGLELRLYINYCPQDIAKDFDFNRNYHFRSEYKYRMNNNDVIMKLFDSGFRIGLN